MNYNTLKASYPSIKSSNFKEEICLYPGPAPPNPKEIVGLGGVNCKELGVAPGDGTDAGYRIVGQVVDSQLIYNDKSGYPLSSTEKWLSDGGKCFGQKWLCNQTIYGNQGQNIYSIPVFKCTENGVTQDDLQKACNVLQRDSILPECARWAWNIFNPKTGWGPEVPNNSGVTQICYKYNK